MNRIVPSWIITYSRNRGLVWPLLGSFLWMGCQVATDAPEENIRSPKPQPPAHSPDILSPDMTIPSEVRDVTMRLTIPDATMESAPSMIAVVTLHNGSDATISYTTENGREIFMHVWDKNLRRIPTGLGGNLYMRPEDSWDTSSSGFRYLQPGEEVSWERPFGRCFWLQAIEYEAQAFLDIVVHGPERPFSRRLQSEIAGFRILAKE